MSAEIDVRCAEIMGMPVQIIQLHGLNGPQDHWCLGHDGMGGLLPIPRFSTDPAAALELVEWMRERGWRCNLANGLDGGWECEFMRPQRPDSPPEHCGITMGEAVELYYAPADTLPLAISRAFIAANAQSAALRDGGE